MESAVSILQVDWRSMVSLEELTSFATQVEAASQAPDAAEHTEKLASLLEYVARKKTSLELCDSLQRSISSFTAFEASIDAFSDNQPELLHTALDSVLGSLRDVESRAEQTHSSEMVPRELALALGDPENSSPELYVRRELLAASASAMTEDLPRKKAAALAVLLKADDEQRDGIL
mmetsp:Transcript_44007/g.74885  ORF Transcript_44007/g.74885 Transcript_44007/m.74885 type:complete len:176 (+) Transcript_44007:82-609(+)